MSARAKKFSDSADPVTRARAVALVAADHADDVDRQARFPSEAFAAIGAHRLLSILIPAELGGEAMTASDVAEACYTIGRACGSTGMIFAMHQIMVAILVRHAPRTGWHRDLLRRICKDQLLLASSTTDGRGGGDLRASDCAIERTGTKISLTKGATVVSYGAQADAIVATARRSPTSSRSDQVLTAFVRDNYKLAPLTDWDALGMRGTCSSGYTLNAVGDARQVLPEAYAKIHTHTVMPMAHLTWSSVWAGLAAASVDRARGFVHTAARHSDGELPPGAIRLTRAMMALRSLRALISSALQRFEAAGDNSEELESFDFQNSMNLLKVNASELAIAIVMESMQACGLQGYRNNGEFSVTRYLRDALSSSIMINNERILANATAGSFLAEVPERIRD